MSTQTTQAAGWRPTQWKNKPQWSVTTQATTQTLPGNGLSTSAGGGAGSAGTQVSTPSVTYFFDGVLSSDHYLHREITSHPVQSNSSVTDHSYDAPDRIILDVQFSDAMQSYTSGQYSSSGPRSVAAFSVFRNLKKSGQPVQLATHLDSYPVMIIEDVRAVDTNMTAFGAKFQVVFKQLIVASISTTPASSSRPNASQTTTSGTQQPTSVPPSVTQQHSTGPAATPPSAPTTPNPNPDWSSDPIAPSSLGITP